MRQVLISVEGQTEEAFVKRLLQQHLWNHGVHPVPILVATKRVKYGTDFKGGLVSYGKTKRDILRLLADTSAVAVTTMYDLSGLPADFPGHSTRPTHDSYAKAAHVEEALSQDIGHNRFRPHIQLHEFEAFMFVAPETTIDCFPDHRNRLDRLRAIRATFKSPEEINDGAGTAPSQRLLAILPRYQKPLDGPLVTEMVGLGPIRRECRHFNEWLTWMEQLGRQ